MKKLFISFCLLFFAGFTRVNAQSDTIVTLQKQKIPCKILELSDTEIKYKKASYLDGPTFTTDKDKIYMIIYSNGERELVKPDELSVASPPASLDKRQVVKVEPFSPVMGKVTVGYERVLKVGMNLETKVGYINSNLAQGYLYGRTYNTTGAFFKGGVKFLLGQDFYIKGLKYAHPLKGKYFRFDAIVSSFTSRNIPLYVYPSLQSTDVNVTAYAFMINYGRQFTLGDIMTLDYYVGLGYGGISTRYSNPLANSRYDYMNGYYFYSHTGVGPSGICVNAGLTIGVMFK